MGLLMIVKGELVDEPTTIAQAKATYMTDRLLEAYVKWLAAGKPRKDIEDDSKKSGAA